ncbi:hypothetical protein BX666DRAFT_2027651 [Dichotomocladium elegans]|nr:hypothetical protein BX666DRAFT_2027651 [Dichotomocladium elegans]
MATLPYAEVFSTWATVSPQDDTILVNNLEIFPPLSPALSGCNTDKPSTNGKRAIQPQVFFQNHLEQQDWQFVEGIAFSSTAPMDDDGGQWEDIDYSTVVAPYSIESYAEIAERAGTDHDAAIPNDWFLQWPKASYSYRQRRQREDDCVFRYDDESESSSSSSGTSPYDLYEQYKARPQSTRHQGPLVYQRQERMYLTKACQDFRISTRMDRQNIGWLAALSNQQMSEVESKTLYTQAKLAWLNEQAEQRHRQYRPLSNKTNIFVRVLAHELVDRDEVQVPVDSDEDDHEAASPRRTKAFWEEKRKRDIARKQKFLKHQSPLSEYNLVVRYLQRQKNGEPMDKWWTFYRALHDLYQKDLAKLAADNAALVKQVDDDNNREQVLRRLLKFVSFFHFLCKRSRRPGELRFKSEELEDDGVCHWSDDLE